MQPVVAINKAEFKNPEEGTADTLGRLVMAASYFQVPDSTLRTLVLITALACGSDKVVAMTVPAADLDELERRKLVHQCAHNTVVLI
jgi:hypothetical protein